MRAYWRTLVSQIKSLLARRDLEADMAEEMRQHLDELTKVNLASGMAPEEAQFAARRRFGGVAQIEERCRDERGFVWLDQLTNDVRFSVRSMCRARGFSLMVLFSLVLGIAVTTAVYEVTADIVFRASPFRNSEQLFSMGYKDKQGQSGYYVEGLRFQAVQEQTSAFSEFAVVERPASNVVLDGDPIPANVVNVSADCFRTLGIKPVLGRPFLPEEFKAGSEDVIVISDLFWRKHFHAAPDILGRKLLVDRHICAVVGVWGPGQQFPLYFGGEIYRPLLLKFDPQDVFNPGLYVIGRLKPDISIEKAEGALSAVKLPTLPAWASAFFADQTTILTNIADLNRPEIFWVMIAAAAFLYAIACVNVMNLMLIRLLGRRRELSIRFAVGGSRGQVIQLLALEGVALSFVACLIVAFLARWAFPPVFALLNNDDSSFYIDYWDWRTLACISGLSVLGCIATAIIPASRLFRAEINSGLKDGGPTLGESRGTRRIRNSLVVLQAAFAVILLTGTGLMVRSFEKLHKVDLGFDPVGKVKVWVMPARGYELKPEARLQLFERLQQRLSLIPGVKSASYSQDSILEGGFWGTAELKMADGSFQAAAGNFVSADYQQTAGLVMKEGRWLSGKRGVSEVVINETLAKARFGDKDPVGQFIQIQVSGDAQYPIVGVVKNVRETMRSSAGMRFYGPAWEYPPNIDTLVLRLEKDPKKEFAGVVRRAIYETDPNLVTTDVRSIDQQVNDSMWAEHYAYTILKGLAVIALGFTVVGSFSVIAFAVDSRMTEFGVRVALGATPSDLNHLVMRRGLSAAAAGVAIGIAGAVGLTRFMQSMLFETAPFDPWVYLAVAVLLLAAAAAASWLPARRAARVDVVKLLKSE